MRQNSYIKVRSGSRDGVALLTVLAFILLLTILIVSFIAFTRLNRLATASYSNAVQAQEIAKGGLQDIISDLHAEIAAGSVAYTTGSSTIYVPTTNYTAVPARLGYPVSNWSYGPTTAPTTAPTTFMPTLVRVSRAATTAGATTLNPAPSSTYYPNLTASGWINRASQSSTGTASLNGRYISPARWNKPFLLAASVATIPTPFYKSTTVLPEPSYPTTPDLPDWVYVTRTGSRVCNIATDGVAALSPSTNLTQNYGTITPGTNPPASPVVGRYAYVIYDEGALLDANVAGSPTALISNSGTSGANSVVQTPLPIYTNSPSATPPTSTSLAFTGKSYLSFADLMQLYGFSGNANGQAAINSFVNWRNAGGLANANSSYGNGISGANYLGAIFSYAQNGFLQFQSDTTSTPPASDSPLLDRQDLINYFAKIDSNINTPAATFSQALPYLGTFSRAISAPTYAPPSDPSAISLYPGGTSLYSATLVSATPAFAYHSNMEMSSVANRDLANVRFANTGTVTHYTDDATVTPTPTYNVNAGDPLLQNRFSLAKINWLSQVSPQPSDNKPSLTAAYANAIQACFGLTWGTVGPVANGGNPCWSYVGSPAGPQGTLAPFNGTIETLDQVAKEDREPNFFEILKAAILSGSLAPGPGPCAMANGTLPYDFTNGGNYGNGGIESLELYWEDRPGTVWGPSRIPDLQIMKIGANIIDQYDADSYPTAIYFHYSYNNGTMLPGTSPNIDDAAAFTTYANGGVGDLKGPGDMVFGEENLPYLDGMFSLSATLDGTSFYPNSTELDGWWQPQLWNPHQMPVTANLTPAQTSSVPNTFEIEGFGQSSLLWTNNISSQQPPPLPMYTIGNTGVTQLDGNYITFTDPNPMGSSTPSVFYANPIGLTTKILPTLSPGNSTYKAQMQPTSIQNYSFNPFVGFWMGRDPNYQPVNDTPPPPASATIINESDTFCQLPEGVTFVLGWTDSGGGFHPYSYMPQFFGQTKEVLGNEKGDNELGSAYPNGSSGPKPEGGDSEGHAYLDPRTFRFSSLTGWVGFGWQTTFYPYKLGPMPDESGWGKPWQTNTFVYQGTGPTYNEYAWIANGTNLTVGPLTGVGSTYYADPDGVVRPADGHYANAGTGDGMYLYTDLTGGGYSGLGNPTGGSPFGDSGGNIQHGRRPVILNRPFRSVGELGYTDRDLPFKTLDFFTGASADAALLDVFSLTDESKVSDTTPPKLGSVVAGQVDLSNAPLPVIQSLLSGGSKKDLDPTYNLDTESGSVFTNLALSIAKNFNSGTGVSNPLVNRGALVTQMQPAIQAINSHAYYANPANATNPIYTSTADQSNKAYLEAPVRALADVTNTRTWNLLIDIIAQSGQMASNATSLNQFAVAGERRYWLHVSIDRYTGKIVAQQLEPVYE